MSRKRGKNPAGNFGGLSDRRHSKVLVGEYDFVPDTHYPVDELLKKPPYSLPPERVKALRYNSYMYVKNKLGRDMADNIIPYWNKNVVDFDERQNPFATVKEFFPVANRVNMFSNTTKGKTIDVVKISFGIPKLLYDNWLKTGQVAFKNIVWQADPDVVYKDCQIACGNPWETNDRIKTKKVPMVQLWKVWCKANGLKMSEAIIDAMKLQMDLKPSNVELPDISEFEDGKTINDFTYVIPARNAGNSNKKSYAFKLHNNIVEETRTMMVRYNRYAAIEGKHQLTRTEYFERALLYMNKAVYNQLEKYKGDLDEYQRDVEYYRKYLKNQKEGE